MAKAYKLTKAITFMSDKLIKQIDEFITANNGNENAGKELRALIAKEITVLFPVGTIFFYSKIYDKDDGTPFIYPNNWTFDEVVNQFKTFEKTFLEIWYRQLSYMAMYYKDIEIEEIETDEKSFEEKYIYSRLRETITVLENKKNTIEIEIKAINEILEK